MDKSQHISPDFDPSLEDDQLWDVLGNASSAAPSETFVQNTVRAARLSEDRKPSVLSLLAKPVFAAGGLIALIAIIATIHFTSQPGNSGNTIANPDDAPAQEADWLEQDLLSVAAEDPELFSDEEIVAMVF